MLSHPRCLCLRLVQLGESPSLCPATGCYYPMQHCASQLQCHRQCQPSSHDHDPACPGLPQNAYGRKFNESVFYETADAMKANGMQAAGYEYIVIAPHPPPPQLDFQTFLRDCLYSHLRHPILISRRS